MTLKPQPNIREPPRSHTCCHICRATVRVKDGGEQCGRGIGKRSNGGECVGDLTSEEFRHMMNDLKIQKDTEGKVFEIPFFADFIVPVDRRQTARGPCASGWAFREAGALKVHKFRKTGQIVSLSERNPLDYSRSQGSEGCPVGLVNYAFQYILNNGGLDSEESYPYRPGVSGALHVSSVQLCS
ncbi:procathepsin L-like isoform X5 [Mustela putorius furo]|uniref:Procathepsin L-like isoform X5 n=1 Tax=Mustela putorius furo TaxID=9669 RepID=A0A8U0V956_MUSPF|nr:procathepsin L-like isoform X5 [Mustela putorius furo]